MGMKNRFGLAIFVLMIGLGALSFAGEFDEMEVLDGGDTISVEFKDADVQDVFRVLSLKKRIIFFEFRRRSRSLGFNVTPQSLLSRTL